MVMAMVVMMWRVVVAMVVVMVVAVAGEGEADTPYDPPPLVVGGDAIIGVIADLHSRGDGGGHGGGSGGGGGGCGAVMPRAVEQVVAASWALDTINNQSHQDYTIGMRVYDACGDEDLALRQTIRLLQDTAAPSPPLLGVVALGSSRVVSGTATPLHAFRTPILITDAAAARTTTPTDNTFTTAPHLTDQLQAVLAAAVRVGGGVAGVSVVSGCVHATEVLQEQASRVGLRLHHMLHLNHEPRLTSAITHFINTQVQGYGGVVVVLLSSAELSTFVSEVEESVLSKAAGLSWVFSTLGADPIATLLTQKGVRDKFSGSLLVESHAPVIPGFSRYFVDAILNKSSVAAPLTRQYLETVAHCDTPVVVGGSESTVSPCVGVEELAAVVQGSSTTPTVKAVSSLAAAFRLVQIEKCSEGVRCLGALRQDLHQDVLVALLKLSFRVGGGADRIRYTADGRLVNSFSIIHVTPQGGRQVGTYREDTGVVWSPGEMVDPAKVEKNRKGRTLGLVAEGTEPHRGVVKTVLLTHQDYIGRTWAFSVLVMACMGVVASLYITVYVALRVCDGTLRGPQVLGAVLLLAVMGVFASCVVYVLPPGALTCAVRQWAPPLCLALCYGILLVKSMHLRALVTVGAEGKVSQLNLHISLLFMVMVQMSLCMLGHAGGLSVGQDPLVKVEPGGARVCGMKPLATLATRVYLLLLLLVCLVFAAFNRKIQRNHNEGHWLLLTSCVSVPVLVVWAVMSYLAPPSLEAPTTSVALLVLAAIVLGLVFIPKMRVISRQAKEFRHKRLAAAAAPVSTVLSQLENGSVRGLARLQDGMKQQQLHSASPQHLPQHTSGSIRSSVASQNSYRVAFNSVYGMPQSPSLSLTSPTHILRNNIYDTSSGAFP